MSNKKKIRGKVSVKTKGKENGKKNGNNEESDSYKKKQVKIKLRSKYSLIVQSIRQYRQVLKIKVFLSRKNLKVIWIF
jgi:hypothetical protein